MRWGGIVLAAGASQRAGSAKALAVLDGETLVARAVRTLRDAGASEIVVVVGPPHGSSIRRALSDATPHAPTFAENEAPARGMTSSLQISIAIAERAGWDAAIVSLVDHTRVRSSTVRALVDAWEDRGAALVRPRAGERTGHPYLVARSVFPILLAAPERATAREILAEVAHREDVATDDLAVLEDLDTAPQLAAAGARGTGP